MSQPELRTRRELVQDAIRRIITYTDQIKWFGVNSVGRAIGESVGGQTSIANRLYGALIRRTTLLASSGDFTTAVAEEHGARKLGPQRSKVLAIVVPRSALVTAITIGATDLIEVDDSTEFVATDSIRIRSADGSITETAVIIAITSGTGPNSGDEIEVATLAGTYAPLTEDVRVLLRVTVPADTEISSTAGVSFTTTATLTVGDSNPVLDGESEALSLADKVFVEAITPGASGDIDADSLIEFVPANSKVLRVYNPERGTGGDDTETDFDLKYRAANTPAILSQETAQFYESIAAKGDTNALRAIRTDSSQVATVTLKVLHRNGGPLTAAAKTSLSTYIEARVKSGLAIVILDVTLTSVEVSAQITLDPDTTLRDVWKEASARLASSIDFRKWTFGLDVDEADLLSIVNQTPGVASLTTSSFLPASNIVVGDESLPHLVRLTLEDTATGDIFGADLEQTF